MATFNIKQGDTAVAIGGTLKGANGVIPDITGSTVKINIWNDTSVLIDHGACVIVGAGTLGYVQYSVPDPQVWPLGDYDAEFEVTFPSGKKLSFPTWNFKIRVLKQGA